MAQPPSPPPAGATGAPLQAGAAVLEHLFDGAPEHIVDGVVSFNVFVHPHAVPPHGKILGLDTLHRVGWVNPETQQPINPGAVMPSAATRASIDTFMGDVLQSLLTEVPPALGRLTTALKLALGREETQPDAAPLYGCPGYACARDFQAGMVNLLSGNADLLAQLPAAAPRDALAVFQLLLTRARWADGGRELMSRPPVLAALAVLDAAGRQHVLGLLTSGDAAFFEFFVQHVLPHDEPPGE